MVVIKKDADGAVAGVGDAVLFSGFFEDRDAVAVGAFVDIEQVCPEVRVITERRGYIEIGKSVSVDVDDGGARAPVTGTAYSSAVGDVFEAEMAPVEIELAGDHIAGEEDVGESVIIEVADANSTAIVDVGVIENIQTIVFG